MKITAALAAVVIVCVVGLWLWLPDAVRVSKPDPTPAPDIAAAEPGPAEAIPSPSPLTTEPWGDGTDPAGTFAAQPDDPLAEPTDSPSRPGMAPPVPPAIDANLKAMDLQIPVAGIDATSLVDTFTDARSGGRSHDAIDIMAPVGTQVLAVADGTIAKLFDSQHGGLTLYQFDVSGALAFYYAHLDAYADGLVEGAPVRKGEVIGTVGYTGNAHPAAPHLHFAIFVLGPERKWWQGTAINPFPYLRGP